MPKSSRGGKRYGGGGGLNPGDIKSTSDMGSMVAEGNKRAEAKEVLAVASAMVKEYGEGVQIYSFQVAELSDKAKASTIAYYDGANIAMNNFYFDSAKLEQAYASCVSSGFHPSNGNKSAIQAVAAHEYGHALSDFAAQKMGVGDLHAASDIIVKEARSMTTSKGVVQMASKISTYATHSNAEAVAEAVSDVYCNGAKAAAESRAIVSVLNKYLK